MFTATPMDNLSTSSTEWDKCVWHSGLVGTTPPARSWPRTASASKATLQGVEKEYEELHPSHGNLLTVMGTVPHLCVMLSDWNTCGSTVACLSLLRNYIPHSRKILLPSWSCFSFWKLNFILCCHITLLYRRVPVLQPEYCLFFWFFPQTHNSSYWPLSHTSQKTLSLVMLKNIHNHQFNKAQKQVTQISPKPPC